MKIKLILMVISLSLISCAELANEAKSWINEADHDEIEGKYHFLEEDGTKVFLPLDFERYSIADYQKVLDSVLDGKEYDFEVNRLNSLKAEKGEFYIFYDEYSRSTYTVNTLDYMPFTKQEASQILGLIRAGLNKNAKDIPVSIEKVTAKYSGDKSQHIFKTVYRISDKQSDNEWYSATYFITSNLKTVYVNLTTGFDVNFDAFITKTIM